MAKDITGAKLSIEEMAIFCKKKGFVYRNSDIYGGQSGFWDFGHLGVELKNNIINSWWHRFVSSRDDVVGIDGAIITNPKVWEASGHVSCFTDALMDCTKCQHRIRADHLLEDELKISSEGMSIEDINNHVRDNKLKCPKCGSGLKEAKPFNLMFTTVVGPVEAKEHIAYLRPETAQLIFANYKLVQEHARTKLPFGIAQVGKAFRNEIGPRDFLFRSREFSQMEIEFFTHPDKINDCPRLKEHEKLSVNILTAELQSKGKTHTKMTIKDIVGKKLCTAWHAYWLAEFYKWFLNLGIKPENLRLREHLKDELAHYAGACFDIEYNFPFGWKEIHGNADRKQFDLQQHIEHSKQDMSYFDEDTKEKVVPYVASEPSQGVERALLALMFDAYEDDKKRGNVVLRLNPKLAPVNVGVFPLVNKLELQARQVLDALKNDFVCRFDRSGSIGRRYARADEIGIPVCVTVDFDYIESGTATLRCRDTTKQIRVKSDELKSVIQRFLSGEKLTELGVEI